MIYELLIACHDQVMKASSTGARTDGDFESASMNIKEFVNEIRLIVGGAQYNGRYLLQDTVDTVRGFASPDFDASTIGAIADPAGVAAYGETTNFTTQVTLSAAANQNDLSVTFDTGAISAKKGDIIYQINDGTTDVSAVQVGTVNADATDATSLTTTALAIALPDNSVLSIVPGVLTDVLIYGDSVERESITSRLKGPRGFCRNVSSVFNDFVFELPKVGIHSLKLTSFTSSGGQDYHIQGLSQWTGDDGVFLPDSISDDDVDETINDFNCAIKIIGVELDKMKAYRYMCCLREKQVRIYKEGQKKCMEQKLKM